MKSYLLLIIGLFTFALQVQGAKNLHVFRISNETYTALSGDVAITNDIMAYDSFALSAVKGQTFVLFGKPRLMEENSIVIMKNGRTFFFEDTAFAVIDCLNSDPLETIDNSTSISYKLDGPANKKILKIQWKNFRIKSGQAGNFVNFQTWIYQESGLIEFHYGDRSAGNASGFTDPVTGIYTGIWYSNYSWSNLHEKMQVTGTPPNISIDSTLNLSVPHVQGAPDKGTVYRFVPKQVALKTRGHAAKEDAFTICTIPANETCTILANQPLEADALLTLTNLEGKRVAEKRLVAGEEKAVLATRDLPAGMYNLCIRTSEAAFNYKVVIAH